VLVLTQWQAIGISVASLIAGWLFYDLMCRSPSCGSRNLALCVTALILLAAYGFVPMFSGRALIHVGLYRHHHGSQCFHGVIPNQRKSTGAAPVIPTEIWCHGQAALASHLSDVAGSPDDDHNHYR
jgi:uncharacterized membrane protein